MVEGVGVLLGQARISAASSISVSGRQLQLRLLTLSGTTVKKLLDGRRPRWLRSISALVQVRIGNEIHSCHLLPVSGLGCEFGIGPYSLLPSPEVTARPRERSIFASPQSLSQPPSP